MLTVMSDEERNAAEGLDITGFHFKWKEAQELAKSNQRTDDAHLLPYWERVRLLFLELGGEYIGQNGRPHWDVNRK